MKKTFVILLFAFAFCSTSISFAASRFRSARRAAPARSYSYVSEGTVAGVSAGYGIVDSPSGDLLGENDSDTDTYDQSNRRGDFASGAYVGYDFRVEPKFLMGIQVGYKHMGMSKYNSSKTNGTDIANIDRSIAQEGFDALITTNYFVKKGLGVVGKAGAMWENSEIVQKYSNSHFAAGRAEAYSFDKNVWALRPEVAMGVVYALKNNFRVNLLYTYILNGTNKNPVSWNDVGELSGGTKGGPGVKPYIFAVNMVTLGVSRTFS